MPRLRQVVTNLLANALKFTKDGSITLRVKKVEEDETSVRVRWEVQDTGVGIRKEAISSLFQPFRQADVSTSRQFGGTGLGLSISKNVRLFSSSSSFSSPSAYPFLRAAHRAHGRHHLPRLRVWSRNDPHRRAQDAESCSRGSGTFSSSSLSFLPLTSHL
jgi:signal transduction histidine kinase